MNDPMAEWTPRRERSVELVDASPVAALTSLLDTGAPAVSPGDTLPPLWHWVALPRWTPSSRLGTDGHPLRGAFLPPVDLPRRMFAGGSVSLHGDIVVGSEVVRESIVESVETKQGRSGALVIVKVVTTLSTLTDTVLLTERQDLVYRDNPPRPSADHGEEGRQRPDHTTIADFTVGGPGGPVLTSAGEDRWDFHTDPTRLMRFSAATANAHRIHYDWPYATAVEGYPGLVVHGPLSTLGLIEALRLAGVSDHVQRVEHRNTAPLFCGQAARVELRANGQMAQVDLVGPHDQTIAAMTADLTAL